MRFDEFTHSFDDGKTFILAESEVAFYQKIYEVYAECKANGYLVESNIDYDKWYDFCDKYSKNSTTNKPLQLGNFYSFITFVALPDHKKMIIRESKTTYELIKIDVKLWFDIGAGFNGAVSVPHKSNYKTFHVVFETDQQKNGCILEYKLKFGNWATDFNEV